MPVLVIVPAFGLSALPATVRGVLAFCLAGVCAPSVSTSGAPLGATSAIALLTEVLLGTSVAIAAAVPLWVATMAGSVADQWRGSQDAPPSAFDLGGANLGTLATLFAAWMFFTNGGPSEIVRTLALNSTVASPSDLVQMLAGAPRIAVSVALPVIAAGAIVDVASALLARGAPLVPMNTLMSAVRSSAVVFAFALVLPTTFESIASLAAIATVAP